MRETEGGSLKEEVGSQEVELRWLLTIVCAASRGWLDIGVRYKDEVRGTTELMLEALKTALQPDQQDQDMFLELPGRTTHGSFMALQQVLEVRVLLFRGIHKRRSCATAACLDGRVHHHPPRRL